MQKHKHANSATFKRFWKYTIDIPFHSFTLIIFTVFLINDKSIGAYLIINIAKLVKWLGRKQYRRFCCLIRQPPRNVVTFYFFNVVVCYMLFPMKKFYYWWLIDLSSSILDEVMVINVVIVKQRIKIFLVVTSYLIFEFYNSVFDSPNMKYNFYQVCGLIHWVSRIMNR